MSDAQDPRESLGSNKSCITLDNKLRAASDAKSNDIPNVHQDGMFAEVIQQLGCQDHIHNALDLGAFLPFPDRASHDQYAVFLCMMVVTH
jgi:hypothetical protein